MTSGKPRAAAGHASLGPDTPLLSHTTAVRAKLLRPRKTRKLGDSGPWPPSAEVSFDRDRGTAPPDGPDLRLPLHLLDYGLEEEDRWWTRESAREISARKQFRKRLALRDGQNVTYVREHRAIGTQRKVFYLVAEDGRVLPLDNVSPSLLPLYENAAFSDSVSGPVIFCEGMPAADALAGIGVPALATLTLDSMPIGDLRARTDGRRLLFWPDNDDPGVAYMAKIALAMTAGTEAPLRVVVWEGGPMHADADDFIALTEDVPDAERILSMVKDWSLDLMMRAAQQPTLSSIASPLFLRSKMDIWPALEEDDTDE